VRLEPATFRVTQFDVAFGSNLIQHPYTMVGRGTVVVDGENIRFVGKRYVHGLIRFFAFFLVVFLNALMFRIGGLIGFVLGAVAIELMRTPSEVGFGRSFIASAVRNGNKIKMRIQHNNKTCSVTIKAQSERQATELAYALRPPAQRRVHAGPQKASA